MTKKARRKAARAGTAPCAVCGRSRALVEHHIRGREGKDAGAAWNLAWVCPDCHDDIHRGDVLLEGWFGTSGGRRLHWHRRGDPDVAGPGIEPPAYG
jgi:hypothetical protein